ncbi:MAG: isoprenylcysteine carboxylmethyltransferase family protein [Solirubrobacterales bacterium]
MEPLPYTDGAAGTVFTALIVIWVASELLTRLRTRDNQRGTSPEWGSVVALAVTFAVGFGAGFHLARHAEGAAIDFARGPIFVLGALLTAAGIAFRQWAILVLGRFFTPIVRVSEGQTVVESGPYRVLAHPSYTGMLMIFVGIGLMLGNWLSLACLAIVPTAGLVIRIRAEERVLLAGIGEPYRRFLAGRARLVPGIW